ncbi:MAG: hypothetical protein HY859_18390 [Caulobacterales bacterium]|nr:hypothetical protein [Caulobacterales bacterium]
MALWVSPSLIRFYAADHSALANWPRLRSVWFAPALRSILHRKERPMGYFDPVIGVILALLAVAFIIYGLHEKREIEKLDKIIAEKEAAMNASDEAAPAHR